MLASPPPRAFHGVEDGERETVKGGNNQTRKAERPSDKITWHMILDG